MSQIESTKSRRRSDPDDSASGINSTEDKSSSTGVRKKRCPNFSNKEVRQLMVLCSQYPVLKNKCNDKETMKARKYAWHSIQNRFNSLHLTKEIRTAEELATKFVAAKKALKKARTQTQGVNNGDDLSIQSVSSLSSFENFMVQVGARALDTTEVKQENQSEPLEAIFLNDGNETASLREELRNENYEDSRLETESMGGGPWSNHSDSVLSLPKANVDAQDSLEKIKMQWIKLKCESERKEHLLRIESIALTNEEKRLRIEILKEELAQKRFAGQKQQQLQNFNNQTKNT